MLVFKQLLNWHVLVTNLNSFKEKKALQAGQDIHELMSKGTQRE